MKNNIFSSQNGGYDRNKQQRGPGCDGDGPEYKKAVQGAFLSEDDDVKAEERKTRMSQGKT